MCFFISSTSTWAQLRANVQDSLRLIQFQEELMTAGWPALWETNQNVAGWQGVSLDPVNGKVRGLNIRGDRLTPSFQTGDLPASIDLLQSLDSLKDLNFVLLGLKTIPPEIGNLRQLESLSFGNNNLAQVPAEINSLTRLKFLFLNNNVLTGLPDLSALTVLENLTLSANSTITTLPPTALTLHNLTRLDISFTMIAELPTQIGDLTALEILDADAAALRNLPASIGSLVALQDLQLANNELATLPDVFGGLTDLTNLDFTQNQLTALPPSFGQLNNLRQIRFTDNNLATFPASIVGLPQLLNIFGERNGMTGTVPEALFNTTGLRLFLDDNELEGRLAIQAGNLPQRLFVKNNHFTLKDILDSYNDFDPANNTIIEFHPQKKVGTFRTFYPAAGEILDLSIDNYIPVTGAVFSWYRIPSLATGSTPVMVSDQQTLEILAFDPAIDAGIYHCVVTHPNLPGLSLESNRIRIIGQDNPPSLTLDDVIFRQGNDAAIMANGMDDFTPEKDLIYSWPDQTSHLLLERDPSFPVENRRLIKLIDPAWTGTDTLLVSVADENAGSGQATSIITVLPPENQVPQVEVPPIYMNIFQDVTLPCTPGTAGCFAFYPFVSKTLVKHFVQDDFTATGNLEYRILEADPITGEITPNVTVALSLQPEGFILDASVFAFQDTTVTVTLEVTDREGGVSQQQVRFIGLGTQPNKAPEISAIPEQVILKGSSQFPVMNLHEYMEEDYVARENIIWRASTVPSLSLEIQDSIATVAPVYTDSSYSGTITYFASEETNFLRESQYTVTYTIIEGVTISGTVKDTGDRPLEGVVLKGFPELVTTDRAGYYEYDVMQGWNGKVYAELLNYTFDPDTIEYTNIQVDQTGQNYTGQYDGPVILSGRITSGKGGEPLPDVKLKGLPETTITDNQGRYYVTLPFGWSGKVYPVLENYIFQPDTVTYSGLDVPEVIQDYTGVFVGTYKVGGTVRMSDGTPVADVVMQGFPSFIITDQDGKYLAEVPYDWSGTITPKLNGNRFDPMIRLYEVITQNLLEEDYIAAMTTGLVPDLDMPMLRIFPNPSNGIVNFNLDDYPFSNGELIIFSGTGQVLDKLQLVQGVHHYSWSLLRSENHKGPEQGLYFVTLYLDTELVVTSKFTITR